MSKDKRRAMTAEEVRERAFAFIDIQHPTMGLLTFKIRKQVGTAIALSHGIPVDNPLIALVHDPDRPKDEDAEAAASKGIENLTPLQLMQAISKAAMVEPTYSEVEDIVSNDLFIMSAISSQATGLKLLNGLLEQFKGVPEGDPKDPFRP